MTKAETCQCKGRCESRRCKCLKNGEGCGEGCKCVDCKNPLNGLDVSGMSDCAIDHAEQFRGLSPQDLEQLIELPCGHELVPLGKLIGEYSCIGCNGEEYSYSFCFEAAVQESCTWHCRVCRQCRDWREWHCDTCNRCVYGVSMPCDRCGSTSGIC